MISLKVSKKELEWIYASINWYLSERRHMSRKDSTEFDLLIERVYKLLKDEREENCGSRVHYLIWT
jgi:hypothetical protein